MATCLSTNDGSAVHVPAKSLPITCKLQNPPANVTIAAATYYLNGSGVSCPLAADHLSFTFPAPPENGATALKSGTTVNLEVRIAGPYDGSQPVWVVENCDAESIILAVTSAISKLAQVKVEVA